MSNVLSIEPRAYDTRELDPAVRDPDASARLLLPLRACSGLRRPNPSGTTRRRTSARRSGTRGLGARQRLGPGRRPAPGRIHQGRALGPSLPLAGDRRANARRPPALARGGRSAEAVGPAAASAIAVHALRKPAGHPIERKPGMARSQGRVEARPPDRRSAVGRPGSLAGRRLCGRRGTDGRVSIPSSGRLVTSSEIRHVE